MGSELGYQCSWLCPVGHGSQSISLVMSSAPIIGERTHVVHAEEQGHREDDSSIPREDFEGHKYQEEKYCWQAQYDYPRVSLITQKERIQVTRGKHKEN